MPRRLPAMAPTSASTMKTQRLTLAASLKAPRGAATKTRQASAYRTREQTLESIITLFFGYRSTSDPRKNPERATVEV